MSRVNVSAANAYDHMAYLCYKVHVQGWRLQPIDHLSEELTCATQEELAPNHAFTWARDVCPGKRLLRYHLDRPPVGSACLLYTSDAADDM
eukprot:329143-Prymnesium_polylepis.1